MMKISPDVTEAVHEARTELSPLLKKLDFRVFSRYNIGYLKYQQDPVAYFIDAEIERFLHTANYINAVYPKYTKILDIGIFIPILPITLAKLGYQVEAIEKLALYENSLDPILEYVQNTYKVQIHDIDIISGDISKLNSLFDIVLLMAILEHLNGSPKRLLERCKEILKPSGNLFVEVPNIANISKRISFFLKGKSPFPEYSDYFLSEYPFEGHNREYTFRELEYALSMTGFEIRHVEYLNSKLFPGSKSLSHIIRGISKLRSNWRDVIWTVSQPSSKQDLI
jgi:2-polyprenyl-3-methyl-5-hydroxy-6-metoxy-1,4-benzoquinol methylase